jgi:hypothetical protein
MKKNKARTTVTALLLKNIFLILAAAVKRFQNIKDVKVGQF